VLKNPADRAPRHGTVEKETGGTSVKKGGRPDGQVKQCFFTKGAEPTIPFVGKSKRSNTNRGEHGEQEWTDTSRGKCSKDGKGMKFGKKKKLGRDPPSYATHESGW